MFDKLSELFRTFGFFPVPVFLQYMLQNVPACFRTTTVFKSFCMFTVILYSAVIYNPKNITFLILFCDILFKGSYYIIFIVISVRYCVLRYHDRT